MSAFELKELEKSNPIITYISISLLDKLHLDVHQIKERQMVLPLDHEDFRSKDQLKIKSN
jgi:hypothetical protein